MEICINIKSCDDCKHSDHTGQLTPGGAKPCCNHSETVSQKGSDCFKRVIPYRTVYNEIWNRNMREAKTIPQWCPLKNGFNY